MVEVLGWLGFLTVLSILLGVVTGRVIRKWQNAELAVDFGEAVMPVPDYIRGLSVRTTVNQWPNPNARLVPMDTKGMIIKVEPVYHIQWPNGVVSVLSQSAMDAEIEVLSSEAA